VDPSVPVTKNPFSTFAVNPEGVTFESQEEGENIILLLRAHIVTLVPSIIGFVFLAILPVLILGALGFFSVPISSLFAPMQFLLTIIFWYLLVFAYGLYRFIFWYFNVYILTNERIIDFDFKGILNKQAAYAKLQQIEDVSPKMIGFFSTFFNFGDVFIQTAGESPEFEFLKVPHPDAVATKILEEVRKEESEAPGEII
jgi:uncharacterized membrane protein YdbT with pleckstrin-like domain